MMSLFCLVQEPHDNVISFEPYISDQLGHTQNKCGRDCSKIHRHIGLHREQVQEYREILSYCFTKLASLCSLMGACSGLVFSETQSC